MKLLRDFFDLEDSEMKMIAASEIENDQDAKFFFGLK